MKGNKGGIIDRLLTYIRTENGMLSVDAESIVATQIKDFLDEIPGGFFIYDAAEGEKILYANKALLHIFKCETFQEFLELTNGSFRGIVHPDDLDEVEKSIQEQIAQSQDDLDFVEYRIICKDKSIRLVEDYGHFAHTEAGDIFYVFISDATEKINQRLQERLQRLEIIEGLSVNYDSILYFDLDSDTVLPYRLSSRMKEHFSAKWEVRKYNELIKDYIAAWVHPDDRASVTESLATDYMCKVLKDTPTYYFNYRCIQNGETVHLQLRIVNVSKQDRASKFVLGFRRIDDEILREIKQKQILEDALKASRLAAVAKNAFLANMSHDMRTPLNAIFGFAELARKSLSNKQDIGYYLDRIDDAGKQILDLTAQVLAISDAKTQDFVVQKAACDLKELMNEVFEATRSEAVKKNLDVTLNLDALQHSAVIADCDKIKEILHVLTGNALKYNKKNGKIELSVTEKQQDRSIYTYSFVVKDTGIGIGSDALERIFEPFEREKDTTESGISGAGLGLTLARHNAGLLGGNIRVESAKGAGSTFTFAVDLKLADEVETADGEVQADSLSALNILLVEDNEINMEIAVEILGDAGFHIDTAENGQIAVEKIKNSPENKYDIVLMDIQMPVMDGRQATASIRALGGKRAEIPVIALSANALERDKQLSLACGMNAHLTKPIDVELIKKTIAEILTRRKG